MRRFFPWLVWIACWIIIGGAGLAAYWLWWPVEPFVTTLSNIPRPIMNPGKIVHQGERIQFQVAAGFHYTDGVSVTVTAQLMNDFLLPLPERTFITTYGPWESRINSNYIVPEFAPPGPYKLRLFTAIHINPLRSIYQMWETEEFQVVAAEPSRDKIPP